MEAKYTALQKVRSKVNAGGSWCGRTRTLQEYSERTLHGFRVLLSVTMFLLSVCTGLFSAINGPSLPDLRVRYVATVEQISASLGAKNIGYLVGSLLGGVINDRFLDQASLVMGVAMLVAGVSTLLIPWGQMLWVLGVLSFTQGIGHGLSAPASIATATSLWGKRSATPLHCVLFGWPIGMVIAPLICSPFISAKGIQSVSYNNVTVYPNITTAETSTETNLQLAPIETHYFITGFVTMFIAVVFFILHCVIPRELFLVSKKPKKSVMDMFDPRSCANGQAAYGVILVALFTLYVIFNSGIGRMNALIYSYLIDSDLGFTSDEAVLFIFAINMAAMASRTLATLVLLKVPIQVVTFVEVIGNLLCVVGMVVFGTQGKIYLWVFTIASNAFTGPMFPGQYAWIDRYLILYSVVVSMAAMGIGLTGYFFEWLNGFLYTNVSRDGILYSRLGSSIICCVLIIIMQVLASSHGERNRETTIKIEDQDTKNESKV